MHVQRCLRARGKLISCVLIAERSSPHRRNERCTSMPLIWDSSRINAIYVPNRSDTRESEARIPRITWPGDPTDLAKVSAADLFFYTDSQ
ncbi:zinc finger protein OZF [Gracilaria domingensis]|nr:zinc finger protein OZF [Gracilaria domingensis]